MSRAVVTAVVLAGGSGTRFGGAVSKVYVELGGRPVLAHALQLVGDHPLIDHVVVVIREADRSAYDAVATSAPTHRIRAVVPGGSTRQGSEWAGISAIAEVAPDTDLVLLHDAARPLCTPDLLTRLLDACTGGAAAIPGVEPVTDLVDGDGRRVATDDLVGVQTPQAVPLAVLQQAYPPAMAAGFDGVDTAQTVQAFADVAVRVVPGDRENTKLTHPGDLPAMAAVLRRRRQRPAPGGVR